MTGMSWDNFRRMIERNKAPGSIFRYYKPDDANKMSICDFGLPRRNGMTMHAAVGHSEADNWYQNSFACNVGYLDGGYVPMFNDPGVYNPETEEWEVFNVRGAVSAVRILLGSGCLEKTDEIRDFVQRYAKCAV